MREIFRKYDVRGVYPKEIDEDVVRDIGRATGTLLGKRRIVVGRDGRLSSPSLEKALIEGLTDSGIDVISLGLVPTPVLTFNARNFDGGIMITASHNPPEFNGLKFITSDGSILPFETREEIRNIAEKKEFEKGKGNVTEYDGISVYTRRLEEMLKIKKRFRIVVDFGNGAGSTLLNFLSRYSEVIPLNDEIDGNFPGRGPVPTEETLKEAEKRVVEEGADFGVGFDGDADRVVFIDDEGNVVDANRVFCLFAKEMMKRGKNIFVVSIDASRILEEYLQGAEIRRTKVGLPFIIEGVNETGAVLGMEPSNHWYFPEFQIYSDTLYPVLFMMKVLEENERNLSEMISELPKTEIVTYKIPVPERFKSLLLKELVKQIPEKANRTDGLLFRDGEASVLLRPSNTEPLARMVVEADSREVAKKIGEKYRKMCDEVLRNLGAMN